MAEDDSEDAVVVAACCYLIVFIIIIIIGIIVWRQMHKPMSLRQVKKVDRMHRAQMQMMGPPPSYPNYPPQPYPSYPPAPMAQYQKTCPNCGEHVDMTWSLCPKCETSLNGPEY